MLNLLPVFRKKEPAEWNGGRALDRFWSDPFEGLLTGFDGYFSQAPAVDVKEDGKSITVKAEMPGLEKDDIKLTLENGYLQISAEKKEEHDEKKDGYTYRECRYGSFSRSIPVGKVDWDRTEAAYKKGVLTVTLPKAEEAKAVKIDIK